MKTFEQYITERFIQKQSEYIWDYSGEKLQEKLKANKIKVKLPSSICGKNHLDFVINPEKFDEGLKFKYDIEGNKVILENCFKIRGSMKNFAKTWNNFNGLEMEDNIVLEIRSGASAAWTNSNSYPKISGEEFLSLMKNIADTNPNLKIKQMILTNFDNNCELPVEGFLDILDIDTIEFNYCLNERRMTFPQTRDNFKNKKVVITSNSYKLKLFFDDNFNNKVK